MQSHAASSMQHLGRPLAARNWPSPFLVGRSGGQQPGTGSRGALHAPALCRACKVPA